MNATRRNDTHKRHKPSYINHPKSRINEKKFYAFNTSAHTYYMVCSMYVHFKYDNGVRYFIFKEKYSYSLHRTPNK